MSQPSPLAPSAPIAPPIFKWCAVQVENGAGGWITYRRFADQGEAITLATLLAREYASLGAWRVAWVADLVVWPQP